MADVPGPSLARAREAKISELSTHFANDDLSLDDLERRIERVYKAVTLSDLDAITADLTRAPSPQLDRPPASVAPWQPMNAMVGRPAARVLSFMSSTRKVGRWTVPSQLAVVAIMSDTQIDVTQAALPGAMIDIELHGVMASFKLIVPPNVRVINETHAFLASVQSRADELHPGDAPPSLSAPVIRLSGYAFMSDVKVIVWRPEDGPYDDDHDHDD